MKYVELGNLYLALKISSDIECVQIYEKNIGTRRRSVIDYRICIEYVDRRPARYISFDTESEQISAYKLIIDELNRE